MTSIKPVEAYGELVDRFPGVDEIESTALIRLAFHMAAHEPTGDVADNWHPEGREEWHGVVEEIKYHVDGWRLQDAGSRLSRFAMAREIASNVTEQHQDRLAVQALVESLESLSSKDGLKAVSEYLETRNFQVQRTLQPSPLFPDGRIALEPISTVIDVKANKAQSYPRPTLVNPKGDELNCDLLEYISRGHRDRTTREKLDRLREGLPEIDQKELANLSFAYGAKAAHLMVFKQLADKLAPRLRSIGGVTIKIPTFLPVEAKMYESWLQDPTSIEEEREAIRQNALKMDGNQLVVIRSSAVKSEDGAEHTGAGVYTSVAVNPQDRDAFHAAVDEVYASTTSERALSYQAGIGVSDERMGLVIQTYVEEEGEPRTQIYPNKTGTKPYGQVESSGVDPNLIELHTHKGSILFDKNKLLKYFLEDLSFRDTEKVLHSIPDHSTDLSSYASHAADIPHIALLAEKVFGMPMQLEYVDDAIVQLRPLKVPEVSQSIEFPADISEVAESAATGYDDLVLTELSEHRNNTGETGFLVFFSEEQFTISGVSDFAFPDKGAVVILKNSNSGHIQTICREKGLMCFYPDGASDSLRVIPDLIERARVKAEEDSSYEGVLKLRFVADGYRGRIYTSEEV